LQSLIRKNLQQWIPDMIWLRDLWRGWSDEDLSSVLTKVQTHGLSPGAIFPVTYRELRAYHDYIRLPEVRTAH
jgi:hypothetical protein